MWLPKLKQSEKALDRALYKALEARGHFLRWFLARTKFKGRSAILVDCRCDHPWGKHPYFKIDPTTGARVETKRESETDILLTLQAQDGEILGVHIENKLGAGKFTSDQPEMYAHRAKHWIGNPRYGGYTDFDTVLVAPLVFIERNKNQLKHFGRFLSHEDIAAHIPEFAVHGRDA
jgi:hypothetical protein